MNPTEKRNGHLSLCVSLELSSFELHCGIAFWFILVIGEVNHHLYVKRQTRICTTWSSFLFTCRLRFIISTRNLVVSRNFLSIRIVLSFFYEPVFYFEKCLTWIWRFPFAVYGKRKVSIKRFSRKLSHNLCPETVPCATSKQPIQLVLNFSTNVTALWSQNKKGSHLWPSMFRLNVMVNLSILTEFVEWEKNKHFKTPPLVSSPNDVCSSSAKIPSITMTCHYSDLGSVCFNQSEAALPSVVKYFESYF